MATTDPPDTRPSWAWLVKQWPKLAALSAIIVVLLVLLFLAVGLLGFPELEAGTEPTVESANIAVGSNLVRWGLAVALLAFVPALLLSFVGAFRVEEIKRLDENGVAVSGGTIVEVIKAVPELLKVPGGFGIALALIGAIIMAGTALGGDSDESVPPTSTPTATGSAP